jgi:hypothetical protein
VRSLFGYAANRTPNPHEAKGNGMTSRVKSLVSGIVDTLQNLIDADTFSLSSTVRKSYTHAYNLEDLTEFPAIYIKATSKTASPASRGDQYRNEIAVMVEIVKALENTSEANDDGTIEEMEDLTDFADEIERAMKINCRYVADCTLLSVAIEPLYEFEAVEEQNIFRSFQLYTYVITEKNDLE